MKISQTFETFPIIGTQHQYMYSGCVQILNKSIGDLLQIAAKDTTK